LLTSRLSVNRQALKLVDILIKDAPIYGLHIERKEKGATVIDAGIEATGGIAAGKMITEICLGGYGKAEIYPIQIGSLQLPSVFVHTNHPAVSMLGSQFADWQIKQGKYFAMGSGPARALARRDTDLYRKIDYKDKCDSTVIVLETDSKPPNSVIENIAQDCHVQARRLSVIIVPTTCIAGSTQISGRVVETGLHKLVKVGLDPKCVKIASGSAPIAPTHPKFTVAMGRTNDAILYAGSTHYDIKGYDDKDLEGFVKKSPSSASKSYGQPFQQLFKNAGYDFYKIDPGLFAPAAISATNLDTGSFFAAGEVNTEVFKHSIGLT
jgi:methenyltetrahydromethanopterin cyclohydrolase